MSKAQRYSFSVKLIEDLHTGTGTTGTGLNAVQQTDRYGNPVIRDSHIRGLIREAAYELAAYDVYKRGDVDKLCGLPGPNSRSGYIIRSLTTKKAGDAVLWTSTARRPGDRGPDEDSLRTRQYVPAGTEFHGEIELLDVTLLDLLKAALQRVQHIGSGRSRGDGLVTATELTSRSIQSPSLPKAETSLRLILRALEPICLPTTGTPENVIPTASFMLGQQVRGAFVNWLLQRSKQKEAAKVLNGDFGVTFSNAYPLPYPFEASSEILATADVIPVPLGAMRQKPGACKDANIPWWAEDFLQFETDPEPDVGGAKETDVKPKPKRPGEHEYLYRVSPDDAWQRYEALIRRHMRNDTGFNRQKRLDGETLNLQLYAREEIAEDTAFYCDITFKSQADASSFISYFKDLFERKSLLRVGRGGMPLEIEMALGFEHKQDLSTLRKNAADERVFDLTLTSDAIIRGPKLGYLEAIDAKTLCTLAGMPEMENKVTLKGQFATEEIAGFNATSGLPRKKAIAIRRGSQFTVVADEETADLESLADCLMKLDHLGERGSEGFGKFRLDVGVDRAFKTHKIKNSVDLKRADLDSRLKEAKRLAQEIGGNKSELPSSNQLMGFRDFVRRAQSKSALINRLAHYKSQSKLKSGKLWSELKLDKLESLIEKTDEIEFKPFRSELALALLDIAEKQKKEERKKMEGLDTK